LARLGSLPIESLQPLPRRFYEETGESMSKKIVQPILAIIILIILLELAQRFITSPMEPPAVAGHIK